MQSVELQRTKGRRVPAGFENVKGAEGAGPCEAKGEIRSVRQERRQVTQSLPNYQEDFGFCSE